MPSTNSPLSRALREAIAEAHARIESTPVAQAMVGGRVLRPAYVALLAALLPVHRAVDARIDDVGCAPIPAAAARRGDALAADLDCLGGLRPQPGPASRVLCRWLGTIGHPAVVGAAYVIVGSGLGSNVLRPLLARSLGIGNECLRSHAGIARDQWQAILAALDAWEDGVRLRDGVLDGARGMMDGLLAVHAEIPHA